MTQQVEPSVEQTAVPKIQYLNNKELLIAVHESKKMQKMSPKLATMLQLLCAKYAKAGNFVNYSYNSDMQAYAMFMLVKTWNSFSVEKSNNPFAFFTQCIKNSFIQYLKKEKRQRDIRDLLLVDQGLTPSFGFQDECATDQHFVEDEQDFFFYKETSIELQKHFTVEDDVFKDPLLADIDDDIIDIDDNKAEEYLDDLIK